MDNLKSALADKVLEISSLSGDEMKTKLDKINRFRDFINACQSLIVKYPAIESELLRMIELNDFDTKIASSRVDAVIRLAENNSITVNNEEGSEVDIFEQDKLQDEQPVLDHKIIIDSIRPSLIDNSTEEDIIIPSGEPVSRIQNNTSRYLPEDIEYEECKDEQMYSEKEGEYMDFQEVKSESENNEVIEIKPEFPNTSNDGIQVQQDISDLSLNEYREPDINSESGIKPGINTKKETAKRGLHVIIAFIIVVALIFLIVFIIRNWEMVLWGLGVLVVLGLMVLFFIKSNKKNNDTDYE